MYKQHFFMKSYYVNIIKVSGIKTWLNAVEIEVEDFH